MSTPKLGFTQVDNRKRLIVKYSILRHIARAVLVLYLVLAVYDYFLDVSQH